MSYYRSYFLKNNTIISNTLTNTAKNAATNIFYGLNYSRYLFQVDFSNLQNLVNSGTYIIDNNTTHTLNIKNTIFGDESLINEPTGSGMNRSTSFDLILFKIPQYWDEGVGLDYIINPNTLLPPSPEGSPIDYDFNPLTTKDYTYSVAASNWYNATTLSGWTNQGVYALPDVLSTIHFDNGNEDITVDITDYVNSVITGGTTDYGLGIAFQSSYEETVLSNQQSVAFFSKYTQTFYEPYVESFFQDIITDDRSNFIAGVEQNLYLYVTKGTNYYNLDTPPVVDITDSNGNVIAGLSNLQSVLVRKGVYKITFGMTGMVCDGRRFYLDVWKNLTISGMTVPNVTQKFIPNQYNSMFSIGGDSDEFQRYAVQFYGIKQNEKIDQVDVRKIVVRFRSIDVSQTDLFQNVYYKIYIQEGSNTSVIVHDWTPLDRTNNQNCFFLNTTYLIPRIYYMEIKAEINGEIIFYKNVIQFEVVSID